MPSAGFRYLVGDLSPATVKAVHLYADCETFADGDGLDKALSRTSRKDLAQDYAAADLRRIATRVDVWREQEQALSGYASSLSAHLATIDRAETARPPSGRRPNLRRPRSRNRRHAGR